MREVIRAFEKQGHIVTKQIMGGEEIAELNQAKIRKSPYKIYLKKALPGVLWQTIKDFKLLQFDKQAVQRLAALIEKEKPDFIYERGNYLMTDCSRIAKQFSIPHIIEINAPYPEEKISMEGNSLFISKARQAEKQQVEMADAVVVVSTVLKEYLLKINPGSASKILVIPNAINPDRANADATKVDVLRLQLGIDIGTTVIGFVGSIFPYHGVDKLVHAFNELMKKSDKRSIKLLIVGDGVGLNELKQFVAVNELEHKVKFTGNVPHEEVYTHIALMDIAVMARSNWYGSPVKIFEYAAMGKAVIAPDNGPVKDVMVNGEDGILIGDDEELLNALLKLLDDESLRNKLAENFNRKVMKRFTWDHVAEKILDRANAIIMSKKNMEPHNT